MAKLVPITRRGLRQTTTIKRAQKRWSVYSKRRWGKALRLTDKQVEYYARGYLKEEGRELKIVERWEHTVSWGYGYLYNQWVPSGRYVFHTETKDEISPAEVKAMALDLHDHEIGYQNIGGGWGDRVPLSYAVERV